LRKTKREGGGKKRNPRYYGERKKEKGTALGRTPEKGLKKKPEKEGGEGRAVAEFRRGMGGTCKEGEG